jgi:hypothetical protein
MWAKLDNPKQCSQDPMKNKQEDFLNCDEQRSTASLCVDIGEKNQKLVVMVDSIFLLNMLIVPTD